jgi:hypothetical protein
MALTFWAELYFRSLKRTKVISLFTKYLVQYGRVCIPEVGTFELVCQPPQLDVADHLFRPPFYITRYHPHYNLSDHQYEYFASSSNSQKAETANEMALFGERLKRRIELEPFEWNGFGTLSFQSSAIFFDSYQINLTSLNNIPAHKVMRKNVQHNMLVGDQQMTTEQVTEVLNKPENQRSFYMVIGWVIFIIAAITILILLYLEKFQPASSGLNW